MIKEQGKAYILPVRLGGFSGEVPGISGSISYLAVERSNHQIIVDAFLRKVGRKSSSPGRHRPERTAPRPYIPKLKKSHTDKEKNQFLKASLSEIINLIDGFATETKQEYPHFDYELEQITSRKALFTIYESQRQVVQFKIWIGGIMGGNSIAFSHGQNVDADSDSSMNESMSLEEHEGQLMLKPMGMPMLRSGKDRPMSPREAAEYLWQVACRHL